MSYRRLQARRSVLGAASDPVLPCHRPSGWFTEHAPIAAPVGKNRSDRNVLRTPSQSEFRFSREKRNGLGLAQHTRNKASVHPPLSARLSPPPAPCAPSLNNSGK